MERFDCGCLRSGAVKRGLMGQVGIIGLGNIGTQVAAMCAALGMKVIYNNRRKKEVPYDWVSLDELYARSDAVVVTAPLTDETQGLLSSGAFEKMKDGVVVVNVGASIDYRGK